MHKRTELRNAHGLWRLGFYLALLLILPGAQCPQYPEIKDLQVSLVADHHIELTFEARGSLNVHSDTDTIDVADLRAGLEDAGVDVAQIDSAWVTRVVYGVVAYNETPTDREIVDGRVEIERLDDGTSAVLFDDVDVEVYPLLGELVGAPVEPGGVEYVNELLADVLWALKSAVSPEFVVRGEASGVSEPQGRDTNFDWRVRIYFQIVGPAVLEVPRI